MVVALDLDPYSPEFLADPYPAYERIREAGPVVRLERHGIYARADEEGHSADEAAILVRSMLSAEIDTTVHALGNAARVDASRGRRRTRRGTPADAQQRPARPGPPAPATASRAALTGSAGERGRIRQKSETSGQGEFGEPA
ncbi:hypothetical protein GCM10023259_005410 [Thermocatellispora tengchongensis]